MCLIRTLTRSQAGECVDALSLGIRTADQSVQPQLNFPEAISGHRDVVPLMVVQPVLIDFMHETPVFYSLPRFADLEGLFGP